MDDLNEKIKKGLEFYQEDGDLGDVRSELDARVDAMFEVSKSPKKKKSKGSMWMVLVLLLLLVLAGLYFMNAKSNAKEASTDEIFAAYYEPFPNIVNVTTRGEEGMVADGDIGFQQAMMLYDQGDFRGALSLMDESTEDATQLLYLGIAQLETNQSAAAVATLEQAMRLESEDVQDAAQWYLALAHLQNGNEASARKQLQEIVAMEKHYKKREAERILNEWN